MKEKNDPLREKSFALAVLTVETSKRLMEQQNEYVLGKQLLRSGTNPGAMIREAANAESKKDFIHKLSIAQKELGETCYWLELLNASNLLPKKEYSELNQLAVEVQKIVTKSILTMKKSHPK